MSWVLFFGEINSKKKKLLKTLIKSNKINKKRRLPFFFYLTLLSDDERISVNFFFSYTFSSGTAPNREMRREEKR